MTANPVSSVARVPTQSASRYLQQLCKHWSHKFPVDFTPEHGRIDLPAAICEMDAGPEILTVTATVTDPAELDRIKDVIEKHIVRFAFRETLAFDWQDAA
ncbi:MAG: DUF2218 domain-containing protein [Notoacmeibacter sp.]|nr:DUF2218 domain-containing protein [Notoacmeibacter sp.]MCC0031546.1 DUF2218 domain-containing protein [Brucellaceae bacterium]